jgi:redox-sensitive bicupin YhaK (pirin superfamily)
VQSAEGEVTAPFIIKPHVTFVEPGYYAVVASGASQVNMTVRIETAQGQLLDEIELTHATNSANGSSVMGISLNPSSGGRLREDAEEIGDAMGEYLITRVRPDD